MTRLLDRLWARPHILPTEEVARRLSSYMNPTIVNDLYGFGQLLLNEGFSRKSQLESKATVVVGYSGAILAYLWRACHARLVTQSPTGPQFPRCWLWFLDLLLLAYTSRIG